MSAKMENGRWRMAAGTTRQSSMAARPCSHDFAPLWLAISVFAESRNRPTFVAAVSRPKWGAFFAGFVVFIKKNHFFVKKQAHPSLEVPKSMTNHCQLVTNHCRLVANHCQLVANHCRLVAHLTGLKPDIRDKLAQNVALKAGGKMGLNPEVETANVRSSPPIFCHQRGLAQISGSKSASSLRPGHRCASGKKFFMRPPLFSYFCRSFNVPILKSRIQGVVYHTSSNVSAVRRSLCSGG